jgi:hypothetical protein
VAVSALASGSREVAFTSLDGLRRRITAVSLSVGLLEETPPFFPDFPCGYELYQLGAVSCRQTGCHKLRISVLEAHQERAVCPCGELSDLHHPQAL